MTAPKPPKSINEVLKTAKFGDHWRAFLWLFFNGVGSLAMVYLPLILFLVLGISYGWSKLISNGEILVVAYGSIIANLGSLLTWRRDKGTMPTLLGIALLLMLLVALLCVVAVILKRENLLLPTLHPDTSVLTLFSLGLLLTSFIISYLLQLWGLVEARALDEFTNEGPSAVNEAEENEIMKKLGESA